MPEFYTTDHFHRLTHIESAVGLACGLTPSGPLPRIHESPRSVLDRLIDEATAGKTQYVSFSGGRDSSAILALTTKLARRRGDTDPIPVTLRYPGVRETDETEWQDLVIRHLGLAQHDVIVVRDEKRLIGEPAQRAMRRRGVVWPPALQLREVDYAGLGSGVLLSGQVGDHVFDDRRITPMRNVVTSRRVPSRNDIRQVLIALGPQRWLARRRMHRVANRSWLRGSAIDALRNAYIEMSAASLSWCSSVWHVLDARADSVILHNDETATREYGLEPLTPFAHPDFRASLARSGGFWGYQSRTAIMRALFSDLLPDAILRRNTKATFNGTRWGLREREFAQDWDGSGVDPDLIDVERLRTEWLSDRPGPGADFQIQLAWAHSEGVLTPEAPE